ncbi:EpsG family protein [Paenibacillus flagellatus]|uniref:EpsG family protein n=1 Tax=Paenibacillus flagellatus TaxID=2211139 RepID=A0A2V5K1A4_9BACL|nr:EpsG family protein [Paenibacillus flagellatus]PYI52939.1 EpsG family protein [Paenibacillus flagellatus]
MYFITFFSGIVLSAVNDKKNIAFKVFSILIAIVAFFRYGVGVDYFAYEYLFNRLNPSVIQELVAGLDNQELLFRLIGSIFKSIGLPFQIYLIVIASVNIYFISKICKKYSKNPIFSLFLYFCFYYFVWTFSGLRQGLTLAIGIYYFLECSENKKTIKFLVITLLLTLIHASAVLLFPLYFVTKINIGKRRLFYFSVCVMIFSFMPLGNILTNFNWLPFISRIIPYMDSGGIINILDFQGLGRIAFLAIALIYYDVYAKQNEMCRRIMNIYVISLLIYFIFSFSEITAARLSIYGKLLDIIILPNIFYIYREKINKVIFAFCLIILASLYFFKELGTLDKQTKIQYANKTFVPYTNIINKDSYKFDNMYYELLKNRR